MDKIEKLARQKLDGLLLYLRIRCSDDIMSNVFIAGSFNNKKYWRNNIFENSKYFKVYIVPENEKRFYDEKDKNVTLVMIAVWKCEKIRTYTSTPENVVDKLVYWIKKNNLD